MNPSKVSLNKSISPFGHKRYGRAVTPNYTSNWGFYQFYQHTNPQSSLAVSKLRIIIAFVNIIICLKENIMSLRALGPLLIGGKDGRVNIAVGAQKKEWTN